MVKIKGNAVVGQSGGPTVVINQSLVGVVKAAQEREEIGKIYGAKNGVRGMKQEEFIELQDLPAEQLEAVANTPSSALGTTRDKPDEEYCKQIFEVFRKNEIHYFFYIGGNDSAATAYILNNLVFQPYNGRHGARVDLAGFHHVISQFINRDFIT